MPKLRIDPNDGPVIEPGVGFECETTATQLTGTFAYMSGVLTYSSGSYAYHSSGSIDTYNSGSNAVFSGTLTFASGATPVYQSGSWETYRSGSNAVFSGTLTFASGATPDYLSGSWGTYRSGSHTLYSGSLTFASGSTPVYDSGSLTVLRSGSTANVSGAFTFQSASLVTFASGAVLVADMLNKEGTFLLRGTMASSASLKISGSVQFDAVNAAAQAASGSVFIAVGAPGQSGGPIVGIGVVPQTITTWGNTRLVLSGSDEATSKRQIAITMFSTGTTAAPANYPSIDANPPAGAIFFFTDGSDLYIKLSAGTVKKVTAV